VARVIAIVPALDEAPRIGRVVATMPRVVSRVIVVDDGSRDDTGAVARSADPTRVEVIRHHRPRGVGASIFDGYLRARVLAADVAVVMAGDGQMDPRDLDALIAPVLEGDADYAKGSRFAWPHRARAFPIARLVGGRAFSTATRLATGLDVDDSQCGYTAMGRRALATIDFARAWPSYGYPNDLLSICATRGLRVVDVPVRPIFADEESKLRARHLPGIAYVVGRALVRRLAGR
jgi:glycosyltransferase involved in cell wall biosynthesis